MMHVDGYWKVRLLSLLILAALVAGMLANYVQMA